MRTWLLEYLCCPECGDRAETGPLLSLTILRQEGEEILAGRLTCPDCRASFPISGGIPRFVEENEDYCGNFGFQWRRWKSLQIDRLSGHDLSSRRFFSDSKWLPHELAGQVILDGGCGAGRFSDVVAGQGAHVIACDISGAVDACREVTAIHDGRVQLIQASFFKLPLRRHAADRVFCMGVIQHTPDPERVIRTLPLHVKPGGHVAYNFYEADFWPKLQPVKYFLRLFTRRMSQPSVMKLSQILVRAFFPMSAFLAKIPKIRILNHVLPICGTHNPELSREQQYAWTLLDTFDWYGPRYEKRQDHRQVAAIMHAMGLSEIEASPGLARGRLSKTVPAAMKDCHE